MFGIIRIFYECLGLFWNIWKKEEEDNYQELFGDWNDSVGGHLDHHFPSPQLRKNAFCFVLNKYIKPIFFSELQVNKESFVFLTIASGFLELVSQ